MLLVDDTGSLETNVYGVKVCGLSDEGSNSVV